MDRATWAQATVAHLTNGIIPVRYGSSAFFLYPGNPQDALRARTAAMLVAAECWAREGDDLEQRLAQQAAADRDLYLDLIGAGPTVSDAVKIALRAIDRGRA